MPLFRKKLVVIEAIQMTQKRRWDDSDWPLWLKKAWKLGYGKEGGVFPANQHFHNAEDELAIWTLEGIHRVSHNDWIIRGIKGELYRCKPHIFSETYEKI